MRNGTLGTKEGEGQTNDPSATISPVTPTGQGSARHSEDHGGVDATHNLLGFLSWGHGHLLWAAMRLPGA